MDETGIKLIKDDGEKGTKQGYCIALSNHDTVLYKIFKNKKKESFDSFEVLKNFKGALVHDHNITYYLFVALTHVECNAHILRYLQCIIDICKREHASKFRGFLKEVYTRKIKAMSQNKNSFEKAELEEIKMTYTELLLSWKAEFEEATKGIERLSKIYKEERCLFTRLLEYKTEHLRFAEDFDIPFTNNEAERNLRSIKIKLKNANLFGSLENATIYATNKSIIETAKKRGMDILDIITQIINGNGSEIFKYTSPKTTC